MQVLTGGTLAAVTAAMLIAAAGSAACMLDGQTDTDASALRDPAFTAPAIPAGYHPAPGWLHVRTAFGSPPGRLTDGMQAGSITWWMPQP